MKIAALLPLSVSAALAACLTLTAALPRAFAADPPTTLPVAPAAKQASDLPAGVTVTDAKQVRIKWSFVPASSAPPKSDAAGAPAAWEVHPHIIRGKPVPDGEHFHGRGMSESELQDLFPLLFPKEDLLDLSWTIVPPPPHDIFENGFEDGAVRYAANTNTATFEISR